MKMLKTLLMFAFLAITLAAATSCRETTEGVGEDMEEAGDDIKDATN